MLHITTRPYWLKPGFDPATYEKEQREKLEISRIKRKWIRLIGSKPTKKNVAAYKEQKRGLMQQLLTGKTRVKLK
jgi:hypothetical protein